MAGANLKIRDSSESKCSLRSCKHGDKVRGPSVIQHQTEKAMAKVLLAWEGEADRFPLVGVKSWKLWCAFCHMASLALLGEGRGLPSG